MSEPYLDEVAQVRARNAAADRLLNELPAQLRILAMDGYPMTITISAIGALRLANRLERSAPPSPLVIIQPATRGAELIEAFWRRLCGCLFLAIAAVTAADAFFALVELVR